MEHHVEELGCGGLAHAAWNNANNDTAILGGTTGKLSLGNGDNLSRVDGSAEWRNQRVMRPRWVRWVGLSGQSTIIGYW